jgi:hypothetical protein
MAMDSISMCSNTVVYVSYQCDKQFKVAVSLNHEVMTSS